MGNDTTVSLAAQAGQFELNVMEPVMVFNIIQSLEILTNVCKVFRERCIVGITANRERCQDMVHRSLGIITALVPHLGYEGATELAREALEGGKTVLEIVSEKDLLSPEEMERLLCPKSLTRPKGFEEKEISIA